MESLSSPQCEGSFTERLLKSFSGHTEKLFYYISMEITLDGFLLQPL